MVLSQIYSESNARNFARMHSDLAFLSYIVYRGLLFPDKVYFADKHFCTCSINVFIDRYLITAQTVSVLA